MSAEKMVSEREAVLRERHAFITGANLPSFLLSKSIPAIAAERYPLPTVTRPRVVTDENGEEWSIGPTGLLQHRDPTVSEWKRGLVSQTGRAFVADKARVALWTDLFANPTEQVDE